MANVCSISVAPELVVIDGLHDVPAQDAAANAVIRDVLGQKTDNILKAVSAVGSQIGYMKGITELLSMCQVPHVATATNALAGTWEDVCDITDKGILISIAASFHNLITGQWGQQRITIDGTTLTIASRFPMTKGDNVNDTKIVQHQSMVYFFPFYTDMKVEHYSSAADAQGLMSNVAYLTD